VVVVVISKQDLETISKSRKHYLQYRRSEIARGAWTGADQAWFDAVMEDLRNWESEIREGASGQEASS
jgi:hypothetical protein